MTLFRKRVFADEIKERFSGEDIILVGPKYDHMCPYRTEAEADLTYTREQCDMEGEADRMWPQGEGHWVTLHGGRGKA